MSDERSRVRVGRDDVGTLTSPRAPSRPSPEGLKRCAKCGVAKLVQEFARNRTTPDGLQRRCRDCHNEAIRTWRRAGRPRRKGYVSPLRDRPDKRCPACGEIKPRSAFGRAGQRVDGLSTYCKECTAEKAREWRMSHPRTEAQKAAHRAYSLAWRARHKARLNERHRERFQGDEDFRERTRAYGRRASLKRSSWMRDCLAETKRCVGCLLCGNSDPSCLDFHHVDPSEKSFVLTQGVTRSLEALRVEVQKCAVLCANCHRRLHLGEVQMPAKHPRLILTLVPRRS